MVEFVHVRTGRRIEVGEGLADRYRSFNRWKEAGVEANLQVPTGTVAEIVAWADTPAKKEAALKAEYAGKNRASLINKLS